MLIPCDSRDEDGFDTRLRFSEKLYGRDAESKRLETIFASFCRQSKCQDVNVNVDDEQGSKETVEQTNSENPFVLIGGYSGAGKSALVDRFIKQMKRYKSPAQQATTSELKDFYFLSGKFDEFKGGVSYSALVQAFTAFFDSLLDDCPAEELESLREGILSAVGDEGKLITTLLPSLQQVIGEQTVEVASINMIKEFEFNRLRFVFKSFMRAICTEERPAVLFLDDLQWMDGASLRLIMDLVTDKSVPHLMFLGAFRSNEVDETHILSMALSEVENNEGKTIERIDLSNLPSEAIGEFIADTLNLDVAQISTLKEVVCKKTRGNILFARKTLEYLHKKEALWRSHLNYQWTWEVQKVNDITQFSDNVVDMLMATITTLPEQLQQALATASFLRSAFAVDMVLKLMEIDGHTTSSEKLTELLDMAVAEGLLVQVATPPNADYRFAHDRIKQAACELIPAGEARDEKCLRLCNYLIERGLSSDGEDWMLFVAAGHLNVMESPKISFLELAQLNLQVGQKASNVAAFVPAASYLQKGLEALRKIDQFWDVHCELALDLHRAAGDVELCLGHFDRGNELCQGVIAHTRSTADKMRMKLSLGRALGKQQKAEAAVHTHLDALHLIDEFPRNFHMIHLLKDVSYIKKYINSHTNHEILMLPRMTDENKILAMEHLSELAMRAWICNKPSLTLMAILRQLRLSFKHGLSPDSAHSFYQYGMIWYGKFGDQEGANRMGRLSKEILFKAHRAEKVKAKNRECCLLVNLVAFMYVDADFESWRVYVPDVM
jgi:predicted ATPase